MLHNGISDVYMYMYKLVCRILVCIGMYCSVYVHLRTYQLLLGMVCTCISGSKFVMTPAFSVFHLLRLLLTGQFYKLLHAYQYAMPCLPVHPPQPVHSCHFCGISKRVCSKTRATFHPLLVLSPPPFKQKIDSYSNIFFSQNFTTKSSTIQKKKKRQNLANTCLTNPSVTLDWKTPGWCPDLYFFL